MAGRIPQPFIDDLIDRSDIVELVRSRISLKKSGKNYSACCPFHEEKTPSFTVSPQKQFYYCFGCGAGGNVIGFLMEHDNFDFPSAVESLAKAAGMEIPREESNPRVEAAQRRRLDIYSELEKASDFYRRELRKAPKAIEYLKSRGLTGAVAKEFALGYVADEWDGLIKLCNDNQTALQLMIDGGMLIKRENKDGYYDRFRDRVMFPIRDQRGRTIAFGGRVLGDQKPKYLNSPETPVFHKSKELYGLYECLQQRKRPDELIVVEGYMDVVALAQHEVRNAVATLGTSVGTAHLERIFRHASKVIFCFDGDKAGRAAAQRALDACLPAMMDGRQALFLFLPEGEDPDTIVRSEGAEGFTTRCAQAKTLSDFVFELAGSGLDLSAADQRAVFAHKALPYLNQLPKGLLKSVLTQRLADETKIDKSELNELTVSLKDTKPSVPKKEPVTSEQYSDQAPESIFNSDNSESSNAYQDYELDSQEPPKEISDAFKHVLSLILQSPQLALDTQLSDEILEKEDHFHLIKTLRGLLEKNPHSTALSLHGHMAATSPDAANQINRIFGSTLKADLSEEHLQADFNESLVRFMQRRTRKEIEQRIRQIAAIPYEDLTPEMRLESKELHAKLQAH